MRKVREGAGGTPQILNRRVIPRYRGRVQAIKSDTFRPRPRARARPLESVFME